MALLFFVRGVFLLSVLPPYEGWDEYQHIAYIEFLLENGRSPVLHKDSAIPKSFYSALVKYPHSKLAVQQIRAIGALSYEDFWAAAEPPKVRPDPPERHLYQAQHSSFYYQLVAPIYDWLSQRWGTLAAITGLRVLNVLCGVGAISVALWAVGRLIRPGSHRYLLGLLIAMQPLFLVNCTRVANDALALLLGTVAVALLLVMTPRKYLLVALGAGAALGFGVLGKTINLGLVPFAVLVFVSLAWQKRITVRKAFVGIAVLLASVTAITFHYFSFNLREFGLLTPMQEAVKNRAKGRTFSDYVAAAKEVDWSREISRRYLRHSLWCGGWSWLNPPGMMVKAHEYLIYISGLGAVFLLSRKLRHRHWIFMHRGSVVRILMLWLGVTAGLCYHMLQTSLALPNVATNIWYAAVAFPWLLCVFYQGLAGFPRLWLTVFFAVQMLVVYLAAEVYGVLFQMVPAYTGCGWGELAWQRLSQMHLTIVGPWTTFPALAAVLILVAGGLAAWLHVLRSEREALIEVSSQSNKSSAR